MKDILRALNLGSRMAKKGGLYLIRRDAAAVIRHTYHRNAAVTYLYRNDARIGIDRIFREFFHNRSGALNDLARRNLIDGALIEKLNAHSVSCIP